MSKFIQFKRNQTNAADKLQLPTDGIISISAADVTSCLILYTPILKADADDASPVSLLAVATAYAVCSYIETTSCAGTYPRAFTG